jgi:hypothetical protein
VIVPGYLNVDTDVAGSVDEQRLVRIGAASKVENVTAQTRSEACNVPVEPVADEINGAYHDAQRRCYKSFTTESIYKFFKYGEV